MLRLRAAIAGSRVPGRPPRPPTGFFFFNFLNFFFHGTRFFSPTSLLLSPALRSRLSGRRACGLVARARGAPYSTGS